MGYEADISTVLLQTRCCFCGKALRDPVSVERGYGPDCDQNYMMGLGEEMVRTQMEGLFDEQEAAEAIRSAPNIKPENWIEPTKVAKRGEILEGGEEAKGGEILESRAIRVPGLRDYFISRGGSPDDPNAAWRTDIEMRRRMVSGGMWYASRAATFGFEQSEVSAEKVDPRFLVIASVQRFARAVGMRQAADRIANFYAARILKMVKARLKKGDKGDVIIFEKVDPRHRTWARGKPVGPGVMRVHAPYNEQFNRLARENRDRLFNMGFEKDPPYFWRYFEAANVRHVVNILQSAFGDHPSLTRDMRTVEQRRERERMTRIADSWTGEVRLFDRERARKLLSSDRYKEV